MRLSRTREGILLQVKTGAKVLTSCVRCLKEIYLPVETEFEELYQFMTRHREEEDLILPNDGYLDLGPLFREYLILATPIKRLCDSNCQGSVLSVVLILINDMRTPILGRLPIRDL